MDSTIFEKHYEDYCRQISELNFSAIKDKLGIEIRDDHAIIPFFGQNYFVSHSGIKNSYGSRPNYGICVILSKYLLLCPNKEPEDNNEWSSLKDFHKRSQLINFNVFHSDVERPIIKTFSGRLTELLDASKQLEGKIGDFSTSYDICMEFNALPKIRVLLLFNDNDCEFPASCSLLYNRHAEDYLDPESLIMIGIALTNRLIMPITENIDNQII